MFTRWIREQTVGYFPGFQRSIPSLRPAPPAGRKVFMKSIRILMCVSVCLFISSGMLFAQGLGASGSIMGTVTDTSGAVIPNATVTVTDANRGIKRTTTSDTTGRYLMTGLSPTAYNVSAERNGFQTAIEKNIVLYVGQTLTVDFSLKVSTVTSTVEVTAETPLVE